MAGFFFIYASTGTRVTYSLIDEPSPAVAALKSRRTTQLAIKVAVRCIRRCSRNGGAVSEIQSVTLSNSTFAFSLANFTR